MKKEKNIKSSLVLYLSGGIVVFLLFYIAVQYIIFKNAYDQNFFKEASIIESLFQDILEGYKITLEKVSNDTKEKDLFSDKKGITDYLKKAYAYGIENESRAKVRASGVNWVGVEGSTLTPIGRLGDVKYKLNFTPEYLAKLEKKLRNS
ncbi:MAG: hypothetical protein H0X26_08310 [Alphaproteobacteria bacterium]|nr:hypothetical protein [Alphaproteobacteria bacterium]